MSNILVFWGREHHAQKLLAVCNELEKRGHSVAVIIADNSINNDPASEFVRKYTQKFIHVNEFFAPNSITDDVIRDVMSVFMDAAQLVSPFFFVQSTVESARLVYSAQRAVEQLQPDAMIVLHSNNFFAKVLLWAAKRHGAHTFAFQEGMLRHRDQDTLNKQQTAFEYIDTMFTWFPGDKSAYVASGVPEDAIVSVGPSHMDWAIQSKAQKVDGAVRLAHFFPLLSEYRGDWRKDLRRLRKFATDHTVYIRAKLHPFDYWALNEAKTIFNGQLTSVYEGDSLMLTITSDVVSTGHSTTKLEAAVLGKPIIELDFDNIGILEAWSEKGMARHASNEKELWQAMLDKDKHMPALWHFRQSNQHLLDGNAASRAAEKITEKLNETQVSPTA